MQMYICLKLKKIKIRCASEQAKTLILIFVKTNLLVICFKMFTLTLEHFNLNNFIKNVIHFIVAPKYL